MNLDFKNIYGLTPIYDVIIPEGHSLRYTNRPQQKIKDIIYKW